MQISQVGANSYNPASQGDVATAPRSVAPDVAAVSAATIELPSKAVEAVKEAVNPVIPQTGDGSAQSGHKDDGKQFAIHGG